MSGVSSESVIKKDAPRWHYIYYALAGFDLVTVVATLILSITILNIYTSSVDENNAWATRAGHLSDLSLVLVRVNTPGNDVFESGDPQAEEQRLKQYHAEFGVLFKQIDEDIRSLDNKALSTLLLSNMRKVQEKEQAILKEARNIFQLYQNNEQNRAGMRMAIMDQHFASASTELADVNHAIRSQQFQMLASEIQKAEELGRYEYIIVGLIVLMLSCVVFYGQLLAKKMRENQRKISELIATNIGIVETAKDGIMTFDDHGRIEMFNPACESAFGIDEAHIIGRDVEQLLVKNDQQPVEHLKLDDIIELQNDQDIALSNEE